MGKLRSLSIRIDDDLRKKLHYIAKYDSHSANSHIIYLIRKNIEEFEKAHGKIDLHIGD